jgi:hypothetical protein
MEVDFEIHETGEMLSSQEKAAQRHLWLFK